LRLRMTDDPVGHRRLAAVTEWVYIKVFEKYFHTIHYFMH